MLDVWVEERGDGRKEWLGTTDSTPEQLKAAKRTARRMVFRGPFVIAKVYELYGEPELLYEIEVEKKPGYYCEASKTGYYDVEKVIREWDKPETEGEREQVKRLMEEEYGS